MSNITRVYELERNIYPCSNKHAIDSFRGLSLMFAGELYETTTALEALLDKITDIRGIDMELYAPKEIEEAKQVIKKNKRKNTMSETPRTDVGVDYWINTGEITELRDISEEMEHELFRANNLIKDCLAAMPVGYIPTHTRENLPSMIADLARELAEETQNSEKLEKELASMTQQRDALIMFLECEMNWMFFRAEYQLGENPTQHELNGNKVREYLQSKGWEAK